jgi:hypothetical protein
VRRLTQPSATPSTAPDRVNSALTGQFQRRQSHSSISPYQNPRVVRSLFQVSSTQSSPRYSSIGNSTFALNKISGGQASPYSSIGNEGAQSYSAPISQKNSPIVRPPVPLFNQTSDNSNMAFLDHSATDATQAHDSDLFGTDSISVIKSESNSILGLMTSLSDQPARINSQDSDSPYSATSDSPLFESSESSGKVKTVSPKDLQLTMDDPIYSAPPSGAFTNISTPQSIWGGSPGYLDYSNNTSPIFDDLDMDGNFNSANFFPPLHGETDVQPSVEDDFTQVIAHQTPLVTPTSNYSPGAGRHSSVAGVRASRRNKPLKPINAETITDPKDKKRAMNTQAARKSRAKKEAERATLISENEQLRAELESAKTEVLTYKTKLAEQIQFNQQLRTQFSISRE